MPERERILERVRRRAGLDHDVESRPARLGFLGRVAATSSKAARTTARHIYEPDWLEGRIPTERVTLIGQLMALTILPFFILLSFNLITTFIAIVAAYALQGDLGNHAGPIGWIVTASSAMLFCLAAWLWFQWVRTGGFGLFAI